MNKVYYLSSCSTCKRIIKDLKLEDLDFQFQDIKYELIERPQLETIFQQSGSYEALFNKRARKYRELDLHEKDLSEEDFRDLILEEYTFLKRPVIQVNDNFYIGNAKSVLEKVKQQLDGDR